MFMENSEKFSANVKKSKMHLMPTGKLKWQTLYITFIAFALEVVQEFIWEISAKIVDSEVSETIK